MFYCHRCNESGKVTVKGQKPAYKTFGGNSGTKVSDSSKVSENALKPLSEGSPEYEYLVNRVGKDSPKYLDLEPCFVASGFVSCPLRDPWTAAIKGFIHRSIREGYKPKYMFTPEMKRVPWGLHRFEGQDMVIVEGHFDASGDKRAVATLGKTIGPTQILPIVAKGARRYILALDGDAVGDILAVHKRIVMLCPSVIGKFWVSILPEGQDPEQTGIDYCVRNAVKMSTFLREAKK